MMPVVVPTIEKCPSEYDQYECKLVANILQLAKEQLNESDQIRDPSLAQLREFIAKHPQIKTCRTDAIFLLRFLRSTKFNVTAACEQLERYLITRDTMPDHFKRMDPSESQLSQALKEAIMVPLGLDGESRHVFIVRYGTINPRQFSSQLITLLIALVFEIYLDDELFQVAGAVFILDFVSTSLEHLSMISLDELKILMTVVNDVLSSRLNEIHVVQLPRGAAMITNYCLAGLPKLKERIKFHKSADELKGVIDESILPTIYGGKQSIEEANERFRARAFQERERLLRQCEMHIDLSIPAPNTKHNNQDNGVADECIIGSFRQLNVD
ncbi:clavesin-2-like [Malaya genurostris]|uniref:clavesin-2-like n=1 Tax=Malaya genurostris TaxID=325434 RepID=UPI0026F3B8EA|nr:clavesin-2-like [Malaya genurostris]